MHDRENIGAHLVARQAHFDWESFEAMARRPADVRQVWEAFKFFPPVFNNLKNSLNGLEYGFGYEPGRIAFVFAPHGPSNVYNYTDEIWERYRIGEALGLRDPKGNPVTRNGYLARTSAGASDDLQDERGTFQDTSIERLQERGIVFLACATALQEQARIVRDAGFAPGMTAEAIAGDMLAHLAPGVRLVPSMVATIAVLQQRYGYAYVTIDS